MKTTRKLLALLLAMVMCATLFAGCNEEDPLDTPPTAAPTITLPSVNKEWADLTNAERYPLDCDKTFEIANRQADPANRELYPLWNEHTGVKADWVEMCGDVLSTAVAAGDIPDAMYITWGLDKDTCYELGQAGKLVNFADYLEYMPNFQKMLQQYPHALDNYLNADGSFYSLPSQSAGYGGPGNLLYARTDMAAKAGWTEMPKTIDEFKQFLRDLQDAHADVEGFKALNFIMGGEWGYIEWNGLMDNYFFPAFGTEALQTGYDLVNGDIVLGCSTEQYKRYVEFIAELYASDFCEQDIFSADCTAANKAKSAANTVAVSPVTSLTTANFASGEIELTLLPPLTSQWQSQKIWTNSTVPTWMNNCINGELPEEDIITLVKWFDASYSTLEDPINEKGTVFGNFIYCGEKDVHFKLNEDGTWERLVTGDWSSTTEWANNEACSASLFGNAFPYIAYGKTTFYVKQCSIRDILWPHMVERYSVNSLFLTTSESDRATEVNTELNLYMESAFAKFITGEWTVAANWNEYIAGLESIGAFELEGIYQEAYDRVN